MAIELNLIVRPPADHPTEPGYYLVWPHLSERPIVLWNGAHMAGWRQGAQALRIDAWAGPLPERPGRARAHKA